METLDKVAMKVMEEGKAPRMVSWGDYTKERPLLQGLQERAVKDFQYYNQEMVKLLTSEELMRKEQENFVKFKDLMPKMDRDLAKGEMGTWIADYFDDAGYFGWETQSTMFKSMLMNAFPPIDALDDMKPDYGTMSLEKWEENLTKFLAIMDMHITSSQRRMRPGISANSLVNLLHRR
jgi:hypothetical protein